MTGAQSHLDHLKWGHELLSMVVEDVTPEQAHWTPPGVANPLAAVLVHAVIAEDQLVHQLFTKDTPLYLGEWDGGTGVSEPAFGMTRDWARRVQVDLDRFKEYMQAVFTSTERIIAGLADEAFAAELDLSDNDMGTMRGSEAFASLVVAHTNNMIGEISCLKGLQGAKGYPW